VPDEERRDIEKSCSSYGLDGEPLKLLVERITASPQRWG
jgi:hypothetical protein